MNVSQYDYIFLGCGCATLSIVMRMIKSGRFANKKILLIDKELKNKNDRTWSFWEKNNGFFEDIVFKKWDRICVRSCQKKLLLQTGQYKYKMIRGIDFYQSCFSRIKIEKNIDILLAEISFDNKKKPLIKINNEILKPNPEAIIFNSVFHLPKKEKEKFYLLQHFKGWIIETPENIFKSEEATLMDFNTGGFDGNAFFYILPFSENKALVEFTVLSEKTFDEDIYHLSIENYLKNNLQLTQYKITETESGIIPMTNAYFEKYKDGMYQIGTAGGQTKPSTGYTFQFIQKQSDTIVKELAKNQKPFSKKSSSNRFHFYDSVLLHILSKKLLAAEQIFTPLFEKNSGEMIFKFLDNETKIAEEIRIFKSLPSKIFLKAGFKEFLKYLR